LGEEQLALLALQDRSVILLGFHKAALIPQSQRMEIAVVGYGEHVGFLTTDLLTVSRDGDLLARLAARWGQLDATAGG